MEPSAKFLENYGCWEFQCAACGSEARGAGDHLPSEKHWRALWKKLEYGKFLPQTMSEADNMKALWVQAVPATGRTVLFNHITGRVQEMPPGPPVAAQPVPQPGPPVPGPPGPMGPPGPPHGPPHGPPGPPGPPGPLGPVLSGLVAPPGHGSPAGLAVGTAGLLGPPGLQAHRVPLPHGVPVPTVPAVAKAPLPAPTKGFDLPHFLWVKHVRRGAQQLVRHLAGMPVACKICMTHMLSEEHLVSKTHLDLLSKRCAQPEAVNASPFAEDDSALLSGGWVQDIGNAGCTFNHITGTFSLRES